MSNKYFDRLFWNLYCPARGLNQLYSPDTNFWSILSSPSWQHDTLNLYNDCLDWNLYQRFGSSSHCRESTKWLSCGKEFAERAAGLCLSHWLPRDVRALRCPMDVGRARVGLCQFEKDPTIISKAESQHQFYSKSFLVTAFTVPAYSHCSFCQFQSLVWKC